MTTFAQLMKHRRAEFEVTKFAELHEHPCSPTEDAVLLLLAAAPVLIVAFFALF